MSENLVSDLKSSYTETVKKVKMYKKLKENIEFDTKRIQELKLSVDIIKLYYKDADIDNLIEMIENDKDILKESVNELTIQYNILHTRKLIYTEIMKIAHELRIVIEETLDKSHDISEQFKDYNTTDPFMVEVTKLLYPNLDDNMQLRSDPPIAGVYKNDYKNYMQIGTNMDIGKSNL